MTTRPIAGEIAVAGQSATGDLCWLNRCRPSAWSRSSTAPQPLRRARIGAVPEWAPDSSGFSDGHLIRFRMGT